MARRPGDWDLLGFDSDPVPADPDEVYDEGVHYAGVADDIEAQIARLRELAAPEERLKGAYAGGLQDACGELADNLGKIKGRFETVGSELKGFRPDLSLARTETKGALDAAVEAREAMEANASQGDLPDDATDAQRDAADRRERRHGNAETALGTARTRAQDALDTLDGRAESVANAIRDASDDDMKDSRWDRFKDFVSRIAGVLDAIADILGYIAAALVIISLFIPGVNFFTAALLLTLASLALRTTLATTGNGSWLDVALDVVALATLGTGRLATTAARAGRAATLTRAGTRAGRSAARTTVRSMAVNGGRGLMGRTHALGLRAFSPTARTAARQAYDDAFRAMVTRPLPSSTLGSRLLAGGDDAVARMRTDLAALRSAGIRPTMGYSFSTAAASAAGATNAAVTVIPKGLDPDIGTFFDPYDVAPYDALSGSMVRAVGGPF